MTLEQLETSLLEYLQDIQDYRIVQIWDDYCEAVRCYDDIIYPMNELDDVLGYDRTPTEVVNSLCRGFDINDRWFIDRYYGYDSLVAPDEVVDYDALVSYLIEKGIFDGLEDDEILEKFDELGE